MVVYNMAHHHISHHPALVILLLPMSFPPPSPPIITPPQSSFVQFLFSIYLHTTPETTVDATLLFAEEEHLPVRVPTGWGQNSLVDAQRLLLTNALKVHTHCTC